MWLEDAEDIYIGYRREAPSRKASRGIGVMFRPYERVSIQCISEVLHYEWNCIGATNITVYIQLCLVQNNIKNTKVYNWKDSPQF